jgi:hypothetical protein
LIIPGRKTRRVEGGREIDGEDCVPLFHRKVLQRRHMLDPGIVHQDVEPAQRIERLLDHLPDRIRLRHVGARIGDLDIEFRGEFRLGVRDLLRLAKAVENNAGAGARERPGDAEPNAAGRTGDQ